MIEDEIWSIASDRFDSSDIEEFISTYRKLVVSDFNVRGSILQISTDEGEELEIGFFTSEIVADITLSHGKVYSYSYSLAKIRNIEILDNKTKWTLTIHGEKKFDYNVVKPGAIEQLKNYESMLRQKML